jgi:hypothetical protein
MIGSHGLSVIPRRSVVSAPGEFMLIHFHLCMPQERRFSADLSPKFAIGELEKWMRPKCPFLTAPEIGGGAHAGVAAG